MNIWKKGVIAIAACATLAMTAAPAQAQRYRGHRHHDNSGAVIASGVVGLALGAAIASNSRDRYYDRGYRGYRGYDGYRGGYYRDGYNDRGYYRDGYRGYRRGYNGYRRCSSERYFDDYTGEWTRVRRCR